MAWIYPVIGIFLILIGTLLFFTSDNVPNPHPRSCLERYGTMLQHLCTEGDDAYILNINQIAIAILLQIPGVIIVLIYAERAIRNRIRNFYNS